MTWDTDKVFSGTSSRLPRATKSDGPLTGPHDYGWQEFVRKFAATVRY
jgi:hypothetical protein